VSGQSLKRRFHDHSFSDFLFHRSQSARLGGTIAVLVDSVNNSEKLAEFRELGIEHCQLLTANIMGGCCDAGCRLEKEILKVADAPMLPLVGCDAEECLCCWVARLDVGQTVKVKALIPCADCGREISPAAEACPNCGRPAGGEHFAHRVRGRYALGLAIQMAGLAVAVLLWWWVGIILGVALVGLGAVIARQMVCSDCGAPAALSRLRCHGCRARFSPDKGGVDGGLVALAVVLLVLVLGAAFGVWWVNHPVR